MNTRVSAANLMAAAKELSMEWQETKSYWRDAKTREFEERFLDPLPGYISRATRAMAPGSSSAPSTSTRTSKACP